MLQGEFPSLPSLFPFLAPSFPFLLPPSLPHSLPSFLTLSFPHSISSSVPPFYYGDCCSLCRLSASGVHVSAILHALVALNPSSQPNPSAVVDGDAEQSVPITSLINSWKPPRKRKESTMLMSEAKFQKHTYGRQPKHQITPPESFDPHRERYCGTVYSGLDHFLQSTKGMGLCVTPL